MKTVAYLRVSTRSQDLANQKLAILEFSQKRRFPIDQFIESRISSRQSPLQRRIDEMLGTLEPGDRLLVSELSRLGRSLSQVIQIVETLVRRKIRPKPSCFAVSQNCVPYPYLWQSKRRRFDAVWTWLEMRKEAQVCISKRRRDRKPFADEGIVP